MNPFEIKKEEKPTLKPGIVTIVFPLPVRQKKKEKVHWTPEFLKNLQESK